MEGDIKNCFGSVDHKILFSLLSKKITCTKTLALIKSLLTAGYVTPQGVFHKTDKGIPQGLIPGPVLCNIYLTEIDNFIKAIIS